MEETEAWKFVELNWEKITLVIVGKIDDSIKAGGWEIN